MLLSTGLPTQVQILAPESLTCLTASRELLDCSVPQFPKLGTLIVFTPQGGCGGYLIYLMCIMSVGQYLACYNKLSVNFSQGCHHCYLGNLCSW